MNTGDSCRLGEKRVGFVCKSELSSTVQEGWEEEEEGEERGQQRKKETDLRVP